MHNLIKAAIFALPVFGFQATDQNFAKQARAELFATRYDRAIDLYRKSLAQAINQLSLPEVPSSR
jgi:hypothetical protein